MRLIAIEEHFQAVAAIGSMEESGFAVLGENNPLLVHDPQLDDVGDLRLADMDRGGIDVQVLSQTSRMRNDVSIDVAARVNDEMTEAISRHPDRFAGFATLAFADPKGSAVELERAVTSLGLKGVLVNGIQDGGRFLDDPFFWPVLETAEALGVPIYLHPAEAPHAVFKAYYSGLKPGQAELLATSGWGWHVETGLHALRLIIAGVFVRFPTLQVVIGHDGEAIPFFLDRASDKLTKISRLPKSVADYFVENFYVTTSGMFTYPPLLCLLQTVGADRVIFSVDYPDGFTDEAREFWERCAQARGTSRRSAT